MRAIRFLLREETTDPVWLKASDDLAHEVWYYISDNIWEPVRSQIWYQVYDHVISEVQKSATVK
jgi:hypothetical protein